MIETVNLVFPKRKYGGNAYLEVSSVKQVKSTELIDIKFLGRYIGLRGRGQNLGA